MPALNILVTLLEDKKLVGDIATGRFMYRVSIEKLNRRLRFPQQEWPLLKFRVTCMVQKILSSNISDIKDETVK